MAGKSIDIIIGATFDGSGITEANKSLAALYADVRDKSDAMRKAVLREAEAYGSVSAQADKAAKAIGGSYVDLEQEANELEKRISDAFDAAHDAAIEAKYGTESFDAVLKRANATVIESNRINEQAAQISEVLKNKRRELAEIEDKTSAAYLKTAHEIKVLEQAQKDLGAETKASGDDAKAFGVSINDAMGAARGSTNALVKVIVSLKDSFGVLKNVSVGTLGAIGAAIAGVVSAGGALKDLVKIAFNLGGASEETKKAQSGLNRINNEAVLFNASMEEARESADRQKKAFEDEANAIAKVAKAQNELNRQMELSAAKTEEQKEAINAKWNTANADAQDDAERMIRDNRGADLRAEERRIESEIENAKKLQKKYLSLFGTDAGGEASERAMEQERIIENAKKRLEDNLNAQRRLDDEEAVAEANYATRKAKEAEAADRRARAKDEKDYGEFVASGSGKKFDEWLKDRDKDAADKLKADKESYAEFLRGAGIDASASAAGVDEYDERFKKWRENHDRQVEIERADNEKTERDRSQAQIAAEEEAHKARVKNINAEIAAASQKASALQSVASSAQSEFDRAFGMYRDIDLAARTIQEERDYAADYKRLQKDASRYGGKWRIDELSALMAAGDTQGQAATLEEWRKSRRFTPEVESMVRAAAADKTRTTAEDELRKINGTLEDQKEMLQNLLTMKGE